MHAYTLRDGEELVRAARDSIEAHLLNSALSRKTVLPGISRFTARQGVFVTLEHYPTKALRGCIGFPRAVAPLCEELVDAAIAAAFEDPRFVPVSRRELDDLLVEVSILSEPYLLKGSPSELQERVLVGRDGLIIEYGTHSGLLLPIVAVEEGWDSRRFLDEICVKAGLPKGYWMQPSARLYSFEVQLFREESPNGRVAEFKRPPNGN